jgi:hypothetical protein
MKQSRLTLRSFTLVCLLGVTIAAIGTAAGWWAEPPGRPALPSKTLPEQEQLEPNPHDLDAVTSLLVLFLPWEGTKPTPPPPPPSSNPQNDGGGTGDSGGTGGTGGPPGPGDGSSGPKGGDPGKFTHSPEPATWITGIVGAGLFALTALRRRAQGTD